mgnify:CR=1 FL=1
MVPNLLGNWASFMQLFPFNGLSPSHSPFARKFRDRVEFCRRVAQRRTDWSSGGPVHYCACALRTAFCASAPQTLDVVRAWGFLISSKKKCQFRTKKKKISKNSPKTIEFSSPNWGVDRKVIRTSVRIKLCTTFVICDLKKTREISW